MFDFDFDLYLNIQIYFVGPVIIHRNTLIPADPGSCLSAMTFIAKPDGKLAEFL